MNKKTEIKNLLQDKKELEIKAKENLKFLNNACIYFIKDMSKNGIKNKYIADAIGIHPTTLSSVLKGRKYFTIKEIEKIINYKN
jgi:antitoxin component HigA of HigAB toxin-antitoxin module